MHRLWTLLAVVALGCGHDVPAHDVSITSDCNGPVRVARFHFDAFDFDDNCTGGLFGACSFTVGIGHRVGGDLEASRLELIGYGRSGPTEYRLYMPFNLIPNDASLTCSWPVDSDLHLTKGKRQTCSKQCFAELEVLD